MVGLFVVAMPERADRVHDLAGGPDELWKVSDTLLMPGPARGVLMSALFVFCT